MNRTMKTGLVLTLTLLAATACTRRVQVESEPNEPRYLETATTPAMIDIAGEYHYVAHFDAGEHAEGPMTVSRTDDGYAVDIVSDLGEVTTSNVRRTGNTLTMDATTPGGPGAIDLVWENRNEVTGTVRMGEVIRIQATRKP